MNLTPLDYAILGLLSSKPMTGYEVRRTFETTALGNYSSSPGSIYPALKKLTKNGLSVQKTNRNKKTKFRVTPKGRSELRAWLKLVPSEDEIAKRVDLILLRFAFMDGNASKSVAGEFLDRLIVGLENYISELRIYERSGELETGSFAAMAFDHGLQSYRTTLRWARKARREIQ